MRKYIRAMACLLTVWVLGSAASAQLLASSTLNGRVTDTQGATLSGAVLTVTHIATGISREAVTDGDGYFVITNLTPGEYTLAVRGEKPETKLSLNITLEVGQDKTLDLTLNPADEVMVLRGDDPARTVDTTSSIVDGVIGNQAIENLPLNGRNFLELALLLPGNAPAPNFDPTKTNSVLISSAGQIGRGGNITVDGADNNDDVVGGPLQNIPQDAVAEFQIATNRFSAQLGRSASSVINVVTRTGSNDLHGTASVFFRDRRLQGLPATFDRSNDDPPFDRQQYSFGIGGPIVRNKAWWFGAMEYRNQDGAVLVGERDTAARTIRRSFAPAPLDDFLATARVDWNPGEYDRLGFRYAVESADDVGASTLIRSIGSASQRQASGNDYHSLLTNWTRIFSPKLVNDFRFSVSNFGNEIEPVAPGPQLTFPSIQDGASFRVPQGTKQNRFQFADTLTYVRGGHTLYFGGEFHRVDASFDLRVFQQGRIELVEDFPNFDHNGDGAVDDDDLLFAVTLRSGKPDRPLLIPDADNNYFAAFVHDDWRIHPQFTLNIGLRYELDTDVKNVSRVDELNPLILPFLSGERTRDKNNFAPRVGFNWAPGDGRTSIRGGYGIYYDRVTLQIQSLERGLDGRALPIEVRAGNVFFIDPNTGMFPPFAPTLSNPFTGFILPGAGASGINIIDNGLQNPMVQQMSIGVQREIGRDLIVTADYLHNFGTHFIIGRTLGAVFNPVVGGPDRVVNLESSVKTKYDGLLLSVRKNYSDRYQFRASYTLSKAFNYANDDQIPFSEGPVDPNNLELEYGPTPNDQRHRFTFSGVFDLPGRVTLAPIWTLASGVPMDIILPSGAGRIPVLQRNAGGRLFETGSELNDFLRRVNAGGGINGSPLPLVRDDARFNDSFNSFDLRASRTFAVGESVRIEPIAEVFNLFNVTNILGVSNVNYSGFSNVLVRDSQTEGTPGFLRSSSFGQPVTTAGGVFGSGGPRAFQLAVRVSF
ncbi:MAG TPA: carboxypeptidase regulatory-like domain-containing protein [Blastocatellia bacterium]|nr:carboxypeptidase regulatory-like domain-containing protein [Blastocatellia bacterium]